MKKKEESKERKKERQKERKNPEVLKIIKLC